MIETKKPQPTDCDPTLLLLLCDIRISMKQPGFEYSVLPSPKIQHRKALHQGYTNPGTELVSPQNHAYPVPCEMQSVPRSTGPGTAGTRFSHQSSSPPTRPMLPGATGAWRPAGTPPADLLRVIHWQLGSTRSTCQASLVGWLYQSGPRFNLKEAWEGRPPLITRGWAASGAPDRTHSRWHGKRSMELGISSLSFFTVCSSQHCHPACSMSVLYQSWVAQLVIILGLLPLYSREWVHHVIGTV